MAKRKGDQAARDRMAEILLYNNIQNTGPYSGQVGPEDPRAGDNVMYNGPGFLDGHGARGGPMNDDIGLHGMTGDALEGAKLMEPPRQVDPYDTRPMGPYGYEDQPWPKGKRR